MYTLNRFGGMLYGADRHNPRDRSYESTLYFVVAFIPVYPLSRYRVVRADGGGWYFLAEGPLERKDWMRPLIAWVVVVALIVLWSAGMSR